MSFLEDSFGTYNFDFEKTTSIENDLGITGEDGHDFIKNYSEKFKVDISEFIFSDFFHPEPSLFVTYGKVKPLTLGDLEIGIKKGFLK
ncbi:DUF1493 family protein [Tenacibaculum agarivorans]|uniref:DUF1493 family protein n=1 Tax=Tenacibaculum agarivorans TaxID=1908389 RepID=UPI00373FD272